jgi:glycerol-3-phosphate dehydrogenase
VVNKVFEKLKATPPTCRTEQTPVYGADFRAFQEFLEEAKKNIRIFRLKL